MDNSMNGDDNYNLPDNYNSIRCAKCSIINESTKVCCVNENSIFATTACCSNSSNRVEDSTTNSVCMVEQIFIPESAVHHDHSFLQYAVEIDQGNVVVKVDNNTDKYPMSKPNDQKLSIVKMQTNNNTFSAQAMANIDSHNSTLSSTSAIITNTEGEAAAAMLELVVENINTKANKAAIMEAEEAIMMQKMDHNCNYNHLMEMENAKPKLCVAIKPQNQETTAVVAVDVEEDQLQSPAEQSTTAKRIWWQFSGGGRRKYGVAAGNSAVKGWWWGAMVAASSAALVLGLSSATLLGRLYFVHGGSRRWVYTWIECAGWPILIPPLLLCYYQGVAKPTPLTPRLALIYAAMGALTALDNLLYSWGLSFLPVSTNSLLCSTQLAFNALFSYILVGQRISAHAINAVVIITLGTVLLGVSSGSDKPAATSAAQYALGFVLTILASALFALMLPLMELIYKKIVGRESFVRVMEVQLAISSAASLCAAVGMWASGDAAAMVEEAKEFDLGGGAYAATLIFSAIGWQLYLLGGSGLIFLASSLMSCVFMTAMIPVLPLLAVAFFGDSFSAVKAIAMLLSIWGFVSYLYGGYHHSIKQAKKISSIPMAQSIGAAAHSAGRASGAAGE